MAVHHPKGALGMEGEVAYFHEYNTYRCFLIQYSDAPSSLSCCQLIDWKPRLVLPQNKGKEKKWLHVMDYS